MAKKKKVTAPATQQDYTQEDIEYINYKMNPESFMYKTPAPYVSYDYTVKLKCKNERQKEFLNLLKDKEKIIICGDGAPGTGKSYISLAYALQALKNQEYRNVICVVPSTPAGSKLLNVGFLKGTLEEKIDPYCEADRYTMTKILEESGTTMARKIVDGLIKNNIIQHKIISFARGSSWDNVLICVNECENFNINEFILLLTRIGENSKICLTGDTFQCDRSDMKNLEKPALVELIEKLRDLPEFGHTHFTTEDIVRHPIIQKILERLQPDAY